MIYARDGGRNTVHTEMLKLLPLGIQVLQSFAAVARNSCDCTVASGHFTSDFAVTISSRSIHTAAVCMHLGAR